MSRSDTDEKEHRLGPLALALVFLLLWFLAPFFSGRFTWGFDHLKYYSPGLRIIWLASGLAAAWWAWWKGFPERVDVFFRRPWFPVILIPFLAVLYISFRAGAPLLGDGFLRAKEVSLGRVFSLTEPLTSLVHGMAYQLAAGAGYVRGAAGAIAVYRWISIAAGLAAAFMYWSFSARQAVRQKLPVFLMLSFLGLNQVFYGYTESYALFLVSVFGFLRAGSHAVAGHDLGWRRLAPAFLFALALSLHSAGLFLFPALLYWWWVKRAAGFWQTVKASLLILAPAGLVIAGSLLAGQRSLSYFINELPRHPQLPLWDGWLGYGILSPGHWLDVINQLMLVAPASLFLAASSGKKEWLADGDKRKTFLLISGASALLFILITDPKLGAARDWDLFAWTGFPAIMLALVCFGSQAEAGNRRALAAVLSFWLFVPWIGINSSGPRSEARYINILEHDRRSSAYGFENLAIHYRSQQRQADMVWAYRQAYMADSASPRQAYNYALALSNSGEYLKSLPYFETSLRLDNQSGKRWNDYGVALLHLNRPAPALQAFNIALELDPANSQALYNLGLAYSIMGEWIQADSAFSRAWGNGHNRNDPWIYLYWGEAKIKLDEFSAALKLLQKAIEGGIRDTMVIRKYRQVRAAVRKKK
jgi:tetratricopeptide (TPR) repeat protein